MSENETADAGVDFSEGDSLVVDFNDVEEMTFEALPRGQYPCQIVECEFGYSQSKGTPMWTLRLEVSEGEYSGRILFTHLVFAGAGMGITKANLKRIAPELLAGPFDPTDEGIMESMLGKQIKARVTVRQYQGEARNNVQGLYPGDGDAFV